MGVMGAFFGGFSVLAMLIYVLFIVLVGMFLYRGFVYFGRKVETDEVLLQKLDQLIKKLDDLKPGNEKE